jgi:peptide deformylase
MIFPIVAYGDPVLRKVAVDIDKNYPQLQALIKDMFETMNNASGVGLAAPQIGKSIRLFVIDASPFADKDMDEMDNVGSTDLATFKKVFINAKITQEEGEEWKFNEGCLSIPKIREDVLRRPTLKISYYDENFDFHEETYDGIAARIIQHEYDHIDGKLFVDRISALKKQLLTGKLSKISKGQVDTDYKMRFPNR